MSTPGLAVAAVDDLRRDRTGHAFRRTTLDRCVGWLLPLLFLVAIAPILDLVYWVSTKALPTLTWTVLTTNPSGGGASGGLYAPIAGSLALLGVATCVAVAIGFVGGLATAEYVSERTAGLIRITANVMVGIPSIIIGLFGFLLFVRYFGWGSSLEAAGVTLGIFMVPYVYRSTDLAYTSVPAHLREAAVGSGARPLQYLFRVATPIAFPQVLTGVFLAMAIGIGETAPIYPIIPSLIAVPPISLSQPVGALPLYIWEGYENAAILPQAEIRAFQAAFLLLVIVIGLNVVVRVIAARSRRRFEGLYQ